MPRIVINIPNGIQSSAISTPHVNPPGELVTVRHSRCKSVFNTAAPSCDNSSVCLTDGGFHPQRNRDIGGFERTVMRNRNVIVCPIKLERCRIEEAARMSRDTPSCHDLCRRVIRQSSMVSVSGGILCNGRAGAIIQLPISHEPVIERQVSKYQITGERFLGILRGQVCSSRCRCRTIRDERSGDRESVRAHCECSTDIEVMRLYTASWNVRRSAPDEGFYISSGRQSRIGIRHRVESRYIAIAVAIRRCKVRICNRATGCIPQDQAALVEIDAAHICTASHNYPRSFFFCTIDVENRDLSCIQGESAQRECAESRSDCNIGCCIALAADRNCSIRKWCRPFITVERARNRAAEVPVRVVAAIGAPVFHRGDCAVEFCPIRSIAIFHIQVINRLRPCAPIQKDIRRAPRLARPQSEILQYERT